MNLRLLTFGAILITPLLAGCRGGKGQDSHVEVFQTVDQARVQRLSQQHAGWQELAITILAADRPGLAVKVEGNDAIHVDADGISRSINLVPIYENLAGHQSQERSILQTYLTDQLRPFDLDRLRALGFEAVKPHLFPILVNGARVDELRTAADRKDPPIWQILFTDLYRITVVRWDKFPVIPVSPAMLGPDVTQVQIDAAATDALRKSFAQMPEPKVLVLDYGAGAKPARLSGRGDAADALLPEFLVAARAALGTPGDIVVMMPTADEVDIVSRADEKLLDWLIPMTQRVGLNAAEPLYSHPILLTNSGPLLFNYTPSTQATQPASKPATAPVHAHIVR